MEANDIFNQFTIFVVDTYEKKTTIRKHGDDLVEIVEWKDKTKEKELHYRLKPQVVAFIEENKILLQVG